MEPVTGHVYRHRTGGTSIVAEWSELTGIRAVTRMTRAAMLRDIDVQKRRRAIALGLGVSEEKYRKMQHALGGTGYRNHYSCEADPDWAELVRLGFAVERDSATQDRLYSVTDLGQMVVGVWEDRT